MKKQPVKPVPPSKYDDEYLEFVNQMDRGDFVDLDWDELDRLLSEMSAIGLEARKQEKGLRDVRRKITEYHIRIFNEIFRVKR